MLGSSAQAVPTTRHCQQMLLSPGLVAGTGLDQLLRLCVGRVHLWGFSFVPPSLWVFLNS